MTEKKKPTRDDYLRDIADDVQALTKSMDTAAEEQRDAGDGADGISRRAPEEFTWRLEHTGLLQQLQAALIPGRGGGDSQGVKGKPSPKAPSSAQASAALDAITNGWQRGKDVTDRQIGVIALQVNMRREARRTGAPRRPLARAVADVRHLAHLLPDPWPQDAAEALKAWVQRARIALGHDVPYVEWRDLRCLHCGQRVKGPAELPRHGAPGDIICPNHACRDIDGNRHRWAHANDGWTFLINNQRDGAA